MDHGEHQGEGWASPELKISPESTAIHLADKPIEKGKSSTPPLLVGAKLSRLQRNILISIHDLWDDRAETFGDRAGHWGVPIGDNPEGYTAAQRAAYSRALKRLETRGLILRQNMVSGDPVGRQMRFDARLPHNRTTHIQLTDLGIEVAKRLTN